MSIRGSNRNGLHPRTLQWLEHNMAKAIDRRAAEGKIVTTPSTVIVSKAPNGARMFSLEEKEVQEPTTKRWVHV